jgi:hypothetical protein
VFAEALAWGLEGENRVGDHLRLLGWRKILEGVWLEPDGTLGLVEVKRKSRWISGFRDEPETGCDASAYAEYRATLRRISGLEGYIAFLHEGADAGIWVLRIDTPHPEPRVWDGRNTAGENVSKALALWKRSELMRLI